MENGGNGKHELIAELETAYQKVYTIESQLKQNVHAQEGEIKHRQSLIDLHNSETRYRRLFETAQDGILILDAETGKINDVNPFLMNILGFTKDEFLGKRLWEVGAFVDIPANKIAFEKLQQREYIRYEDLPLNTKDGRLIAVEFVSNVYHDDDKKVIQCNIRDITNRKKAEKELRSTEIRYRRLFEAAQDGILILDAETGRINDINPYLLKMLGYDYLEVAGKELWDIGVFKDIAISQKNFVELQSKEYIRYEDIPLETKEGKRKQVEFVSNVYLVDGKKTIQCNIRDITHRKKAEQALKKSEISYRRLFETAQDGILILDAETGKINDVNPFLMNMLGFTKDEFLGKRLWEVGAFVDISANKTAFEELQQKEYIRYEDLPLKTKEGRLIAVEFVSNVYHVDDKKVIQCNIRDITDRKQIEHSLWESNERFRAAFEHAPAGVSLAKVDGSFIQVNDALCKMLGYSREELLTKKFDDITHPDDLKLTREFVAAFLQGQSIIPYIEKRYFRKDGETIWVEIFSSLLRDNKNKPLYFIVQTVNITARKQMEEELRQMHKLEGLGTLAGGIAHDFNNILGIILGYASLIERDNFNAQKQSKHIAAINNAVQRGTALVRQILTFARKANISFEPLSFTDLFQELISMLEQTFPKMITFKKNFPEDIPFILADRTQIHQALLNLCVNARDAMPHGGSIIIEAAQQTGIQLKEQFPAADQNMYVCISITDTGEGMNEATRLRAFDPFFTTKDKGKGTGLGLSVVYGVVQAHRGFISVESELGHGTTFHLYFPIPDIIQKPADFLKADHFERGGTETILVVEDEELLLIAVRSLLEAKGYKVMSAQDGVEAIEVYKKHICEIALVLTDMGLPLMNGIDEFKKLREINPDAKIIFASGYLEPSVKAELLENGANGFLNKPYMSDQVLKILRKTLDNKS